MLTHIVIWRYRADVELEVREEHVSLLAERYRRQGMTAEAGKLAQTKGSSSAVREFGAMMVRDHFRALGRRSVGAKSPLTNAFGESEAGGFWGDVAVPEVSQRPKVRAARKSYEKSTTLQRVGD